VVPVLVQLVSLDDVFVKAASALLFKQPLGGYSEIMVDPKKACWFLVELKVTLF
jgi:hypothetical protein